MVEHITTAPYDAATKVSQLVLLNQYRAMVHRGEPLPSFDDVQFRAFSQNGEDGILLFIFGLIGMRTAPLRRDLHGDGIQCNTGQLDRQPWMARIARRRQRATPPERSLFLFPARRYNSLSPQAREYLDHA